MPRLHPVLVALPAWLVATACATTPAAPPPPDPGAIPRVPHLPFDPEASAHPSVPAGLSLRQVDPATWTGSAASYLQVAQASEVHYTVTDEPPPPAGAVDALLGPVLRWPAQARPLAVLEPTPEEGRPPDLADRMPPPEVVDLLIEGELAWGSGAPKAAAERYREAAGLAPQLPAPWWLWAEAALAGGDLETAGEALARGTALAPTNPHLHALATELALRRGDLPGARQAAARALAAYPAYPRLAPLLPLLGQGPAAAPFAPPVAISRPAEGQVLVQVDATRGQAWFVWGLCQATTRFDPSRGMLPGEESPEGTQMGRETACALALTDAALLPDGTRAPEGGPDPALERLAAVAQAGHLGEFILYDVVAPRFPGLLQLLSPEQRERLVTYIERFVLPPLPRG